MFCNKFNYWQLQIVLLIRLKEKLQTSREICVGNPCYLYQQWKYELKIKLSKKVFSAHNH